MTSFLKKHQIIIVSVLLVLLSLHFALTDRRDAPRGALMSAILTAAAAPFQNGILAIYNAGTGVLEDYVFLVGVKEENGLLRDALIRLHAENNRLKEDVSLNARLREQLNYREAAGIKTVTAAIIAYNTDAWTRTVTINRGLDAGIKRDMAVITPVGVLGRIIEANSRTSKVLLHTDPRSDIDVVVQRNRVKGVVEGSGPDALTLKYVRQLEDVQAGDRIITSGLSGIFPKGLVIGTVTKIEQGSDNFFRAIEVTPRVEVSRRLEEVMVVTEAGDAAEGREP